MRYEFQHRNNVRITVEIVDLGSGITGLSPVCVVQRTSDGTYLQDAGSGGGWYSEPDLIAMSEIDNTRMPGLYEYLVDSTDLLPSDGHYRCYVSESTYDVLEYIKIVTDTDTSVAIDPSAAVAGSLEDLLFRAVGLMGRHYRATWADFDANNNPTTGTLTIYPTAADATNNTNAAGTYAFTAAYDGSGRVTTYVCTQTG